MSTLAPPDVEGAFVTILRSIDRATVRTRVPSPRPPYLIKVTRAGGNRANLVTERPLLIVECWAPDSVKAFALASEAWALLDGADGATVGGVVLDFPRDALSSPINMPDPDTTNPRYQFTATPYARLKETT